MNGDDGGERCSEHAAFFSNAHAGRRLPNPGPALPKPAGDREGSRRYARRFARKAAGVVLVQRLNAR